MGKLTERRPWHWTHQPFPATFFPPFSINYKHRVENEKVSRILKTLIPRTVWQFFRRWSWNPIEFRGKMPQLIRSQSHNGQCVTTDRRSFVKKHSIPQILHWNNKKNAKNKFTARLRYNSGSSFTFWLNFIKSTPTYDQHLTRITNIKSYSWTAQRLELNY